MSCDYLFLKELFLKMICSDGIIINYSRAIFIRQGHKNQVTIELEGTLILDIKISI